MSTCQQGSVQYVHFFVVTSCPPYQLNEAPVNEGAEEKRMTDWSFLQTSRVKFYQFTFFVLWELKTQNFVYWSHLQLATLKISRYSKERKLSGPRDKFHLNFGVFKFLLFSSHLDFGNPRICVATLVSAFFAE